MRISSLGLLEGNSRLSQDDPQRLKLPLPLGNVAAAHPRRALIAGGHRMNICTVKGAFEVLVALFALGAAGWWFAASWIARGSFLETVIAEFDHIQRLQARYNAIAASCAGVAALLQLGIAYMPVCRAFG
jgi:hypothetical protein